MRHGHLPEREIVTGIGAVAVRCPRVRDRVGEGGEHIRFSSTILPPYARRSKSLEVLIPILYLKGISTGDFEEALIALLGKDAGGLSASTIGQLKEAWSDEHTRWSKRDLSAKRYVYFWVDGIHVQARLEEAAQCLLVIIGATPEGKKELVELIDGVRESAQSWKELLLDLKRRGLRWDPSSRSPTAPSASRLTASTARADRQRACLERSAKALQLDDRLVLAGIDFLLVRDVAPIKPALQHQVKRAAREALAAGKLSAGSLPSLAHNTQSASIAIQVQTSPAPSGAVFAVATMSLAS